MNGFTPSVPKYGFTVIASTLTARSPPDPSGMYTSSRYADANASLVEPMSARLMSPMTISPWFFA